MGTPESLPVGDRLWVVLLAYFLVFLPWTAVQAIDFISSEWKSVNDTRRDGWVQFAITLIPILAISFYIDSQARAGDYKEMSAAIVALCFAATHLATTWWGLCQLDEFRRWAAMAIRVLENHGIQYEILRDYEQPPPGTTNIPEWKAGQIKVNETIVDNVIFKGNTKCYAVRGDSNEWMQLGTRRKRRWYSRLIILAQTLVVVLGSWVTNLVYFAATASKAREKHTEHSLWKLRPYEPVDVWINWAVAFAAQGLDDWIGQFDAVGAPKPADNRTAEGYEDRKSYFAREVLTSAVLLLPDRQVDENEIIFGEGHPLRWGGEAVAETTFGKIGKVDKMDMMQMAITSGRNLPFNAPHATKMPTGNSTIDTVSADFKSSGYESYEYDLKEAIGDLPSKFGNSIDKFTVNMFEWLTILLSTGVWEEKPKTKRLQKIEVETNAKSRTYNMGNGSERELTEGAGPIRALRYQLGISDDGRPLILEEGKGFATLPFPLKQGGLGGVYWGNRAVLKVSAAIDNWSALKAGDCLNDVLKSDPEWREACLAIRDEQHGGTQLLQRRSEILRKLSGESYLVYANDILERFRFMAQFGMGETTDLHLDQTISFLGVFMETVRSALATGLYARGPMVNNRWKPKIQFTEGAGLLTYPLEFGLSEHLTCVLRSCNANRSVEGRKPMMTRPIEIRLLWEVQNECRSGIDELGVVQATPDSFITMMACILGFPALSFKSTVAQPTQASQLNRNETRVSFIEREWVASIIPVCAPQELYVKLSIVIRSGEKTAHAFMRLARNTTERDGSFDWEPWRDAFNGRLRGLRKWQEHQGVNVLEECVTHCEITKGIERRKLSNPRTRSEVRVWTGWLPHRPNICRYEVSTEGVIRRYATSGIGTEGEGKPINYGSASQEDLTSALEAVAETLSELQPKEHLTEATRSAIETLIAIVKPVDELVQQGKDLVTRNIPNIHGALQCFELAARNDNLEGLQSAVEILTDKESGLANFGKALVLTKKFQWMNGWRHSPVQQRAFVVEEIYQKLLEYLNYESSAVLGLARFEIQRMERMLFNGSVTTCDVMNLLARGFRQTGDIELVRQMVVLFAHCAWLRPQINPLGTAELLPVSSWGSWLIKKINERAQLQPSHFRNHTRNRRLSEVFLYAAGKSTSDCHWLEETLSHDNVLPLLGADALGEMTRKQDKHAPERNKRIIILLRKAVNCGNRESRALLGDIYERGITGIVADLAKAADVYGVGGIQGDGFATERLGIIAQRTDDDARAIRPRILKLLNDAVTGGNAKAASVLGDLYESGLGGVEVNLAHAVELFGKATTKGNSLSAERLGNIARQEGLEAHRIKTHVLEILRRAVEAGNRKAASVLGGIYESGLEGMNSDLLQAVELYEIGMKQWDSESAHRLTIIASQSDGQARTLRPYVLKLLYDVLVKDGNQYAAAVLGDLCDRNVDIWHSHKVQIMELLSHRSTEFAVLDLLAKIVAHSYDTSLEIVPLIWEIVPLIWEALQRAAGSGNMEAATALGKLYEKEHVDLAVETFGNNALRGHEASTSRLGRIALRTEGRFREQAMQFLHEASNLEFVHAIATQAAVLEEDARRGTSDIFKAIELLAKAGLGGHEGSVVRLRNVVLGRFAEEARNLALRKLLDVAWRESFIETSETWALATLGQILESLDCPSPVGTSGALNLFENASSRSYRRQYSYHQLEVAYCAARGLASIVRNSGISQTERQKAVSLLKEYAGLRKEGPMEFFAAILVNGPNASHETILQAIQLYKELVSLESTSSAEQYVRREGKAKILSQFEINAMKRGVFVLGAGGADVPEDWELAKQLQRRVGSLEEKMTEHRNYVKKIAKVLEC